MKLSNPFMFVLRITMAGMMCVALLGALHLTSHTALAAPAHQTTGLNEASENVEEQEGQNNDVNESVEDQQGQVGQGEIDGQNNDVNESVELQEGQEGQDEIDGQNNDVNETVQDQEGQVGQNEDGVNVSGDTQQDTGTTP